MSTWTWRISTRFLKQAPEAEEKCNMLIFAGVGPGQAELITLAAIQALQQADVIAFACLQAKVKPCSVSKHVKEPLFVRR